MSANDLRRSIIDWIKLISSEVDQIAFERDAAGEMAGDELIEVWLGSYHPETFLHQRAFSATETEAMNVLHEKLYISAPELPTKLSELQKTKEWQELVQIAKDIISECGW
jgi:hypothetical protein